MNPEPGANNQLEVVLADRGFTRIRRIGNFAWQGESAGRNCIISVLPVGRTRYYGEVRVRQRLGFRLGVELSTRVRTHLFFMRTSTANNIVMRWIHRLRGYAAIHPGSVKPGYCVVANDASWAEGFCQQPGVMQVASALISDSATPTFDGSVYFTGSSTGGRLCYGSPTLAASELDSTRLDRVLAGLGPLAEIADALPAPRQAIRIGALGRLAERHPLLSMVALFAAVLAALGLGTLFLVGIAVLLFS